MEADARNEAVVGDWDASHVVRRKHGRRQELPREREQRLGPRRAGAVSVSVDDRSTRGVGYLRILIWIGAAAFALFAVWLVLVALAAAASGSAGTDSSQPPLHRSCPPGDSGTPYLPVRFDAALAQAKRALYGQRFSIQGQTYIAGLRNTELVAAVLALLRCAEPAQLVRVLERD